MNYPQSKKITRDMLALSGAEIIGGYVKDGAIIPALSPVRAADGCPKNVIFAYYAQKIKRLIAVADGRFYLAGNSLVFGNGIEFSAESPFIFFSREGEAIAAGDGECMSTQSALPEKLPFKSGIFGGVSKSGRVFAIDKEDNFIIRWSGKNGGLDWEEGIDGAGWLRLSPEKGKILNIAVYNEKLVALCEYGLALLTAYGTPENFKLQYIDGATGKVYANTACVAGGKLAFFTENGLRLFDGTKVEAPCFEIETDVSNPRFSFGADGVYFLCADSVNLQRRVIFAVDIVNSCAYIVDLPATAAYINGNVFCFADGGIYELKRGGGFTFTSGRTDFGVRGKKALVSVFAGNENPADIEVISDGKSRIVRGVRGYCLPCVSGNGFKIKIRSDGEVRGLCAVAEAIDGI
ncbi:MAG: hypothetical protein K2N30_04475 [Clostridia bacterium]|nr:hypothetical protein [Clostridia bacterium]